MLRYQYAWRGKHRVDVLTLDSNGGEYLCMGCGQPMRANTQGQLRGKYFSHVPGYAENRDCAETYIHIIAKNIFYWVFRERHRGSEPFMFGVWLPYQCGADTPYCDRSYRASLDLTMLFDRIEVEKHAGVFIPDLRLFSSTGDQQLYVEILVSSPCSQAKIDAGIPILELAIKSEADVNRIGGWANPDGLTHHHLDKLLPEPPRAPSEFCSRCPLKPQTITPPTWKPATPASANTQHCSISDDVPGPFVEKVIAVFGGQLLDDDFYV